MLTDKTLSYHLGNLEETVLLISLYLDEAYGVSVAEEYENQTNRSISIPAIHTVLRRLEEKGLLKSKLGESTPERGGKSKRLYEATAYGRSVLKEIRKERLKMWAKIPEMKLNKN